MYIFKFGGASALPSTYLSTALLTLQGTSTPLYVASLEGRLNAAKILLDSGANVNQPTDVSNCLHNNYPHCMYVLILVDKSCA